MKSNMKRENYSSLDGLRAYSAIGIAMMHFFSKYREWSFIMESCQ